MKQKNAKLWSPDTRLDSLGLPFLDVVLGERFLLPTKMLEQIGEKTPETIGDIERLAGMPVEEICEVLRECIELNRDIWIDAHDLEQEAQVEGTVILDMRPDVSYESDPLHPSARLFHLHNPTSFLPFLRTCQRVIVVSHGDDHAWSAAMSLRKMAVPAFLPRKV